MSEQTNVEQNSGNKYFTQLNFYWLLAFLVVILGGIFIFKKIKSNSKSEENSKQVGPANPNRIRISQDILQKYPLSFTKVREIGFYEDIILPGKVSFDLEKMAEVGSRVPGRINQVFVKEGDMVIKGAALASISSVELGNVQANYLKAKAKLETLKVQYERGLELFNEKIISAKEFEAIKVEYKTIKTELDTSYNALVVFGLNKSEIQQLEEGKLTSSQMIIRSPLAGTVTEHYL